MTTDRADRRLKQDPSGYPDIARYIDHTLLRADASQQDIARLCEEAKRYRFYSVCVHSGWVSFCKRELEGTDIRISAVCGFPHGASLTEVKACEAQYAVEHGADEIDMVMAIGQLKSGNENAVYEDIRAVVESANGAVVKVILETGLLTDEEIRMACRIVAEAGAHFVKTSTGFGPRGATVEDVKLMRMASPEHVRVKAAGDIRTRTDAEKMIAHGASRIGTSAGPAIMSGASGTAAY